MVFKLMIDLKNLITDFLTAIILVLRNFVGLIFYPYKTMRKISLEKDESQLLLIFFFIFCYFKFAYFLRDKPYPATLIFLIFLINFFLTTGFFYRFGQIFNKKNQFFSLVYTFLYSIFPTLVWFGLTSVLYIFLPPPRTTSIFGISFSIFYLALSLSLFFWKLILVFLALRFSLRLSFYQIIYLLFLYFFWFVPCSVFLYYFKIFRVPFI